MKYHHKQRQKLNRIGLSQDLGLSKVEVRIHTAKPNASLQDALSDFLEKGKILIEKRKMMHVCFFVV